MFFCEEEEEIFDAGGYLDWFLIFFSNCIRIVL